MGLSMKLCISFCFVKFQMCPLFHAQIMSSQLLRNPAVKGKVMGDHFGGAKGDHFFA